MAVKDSAEEGLLHDASQSLAELTGLDQQWLSKVLRKRKQKFRKLIEENSDKTAKPESEKKDESGALCAVYRAERAKLRKIRIAGVKQTVERERKLTELEESHIDSFVEGLALPAPPEAKEYTADSFSNEQEDQILLERLKEVERRAQELAEARKVKAAKGRTPSMRSVLEGLAPPAAPSASSLQQAPSPEELLVLLQEAQQ